jgi:hypothetical protein
MSDQRTERLAQQFTTQNVTMTDLGVQEGLTRERIRQLLKKAGLTRKNGLKALSRGARKEVLKRQADDRHCLHMYGCDLAVMRSITNAHSRRGLVSHPMVQKWIQHRNNAHRRSIPWNLTFPEYAEIVGPHLLTMNLSRGGMVLGRKDKTGPFSKENCQMLTLAENSKETDGFAAALVARTNRKQARVKRAVELRNQGFTRPQIAAAMKTSQCSVDVYLAIAKQWAA